MKQDGPIRVGYACLNYGLREFDVFTSRGATLATAHKHGIEKIYELIETNIDDLYKIIIYNEAHGIRFYRISSNLFPHLGNPLFNESDYDITIFKKKLKTIGAYAKAHGHRLTTHPGQYVQLGSPDPEIVARSQADLIAHATLFKMLGYTPQDGSVMIVHGGGTYGDKESALARWCENFYELPRDVRAYISLENDENSYGIDDLLPICEEHEIPFCLDIFHNSISRDRLPITRELLKRIIKTWQVRGMNPKIHVSKQNPDSKRGAHSKTLNSIPEYVFKIPRLLRTNLDIMLEVKDKEVSVFKIYFKYFDASIDNKGRVSHQIKERYR